MSAIIEKAIHQGISGLILLFVILPVALIFLGYLVYIVVMAIKEWRKDKK